MDIVSIHMNFLLHRTIFTVSQAAQKYTVLQNKYLVPVKPKRVPSAYILFSNDMRSKLTGNIMEIAAKTGAEWKLLPEEEKKKYEEEAKRLSIEHKK